MRENTAERQTKTSEAYRLLQDVEVKAKNLGIVISRTAPDVREFPQHMHETDWYAARTWINEQTSRAMKIANRAMLSGDTASHAATLINFRDFATGVEETIRQIQRELGEV